MKVFGKNLFMAFGAAVAAVCLVSCTEGGAFEVDAVDNSGSGTVDPAHVIAAYPAVQAFEQRGGANNFYEFDDAGHLLKIGYKDSDYKITFQYSGSKVFMTEHMQSEPDYESYYLFSIGANGFANTCVQTNNENSERYVMKFYYDSEGHLVKINDSGEVCSMEYKNGNLVRYYDEAYDQEETLTYTDKPNDVCYMPYDNSPGSFPSSYGMSFNAAYYAGLVGIPSKNLPATHYIDYKGQYDNVMYVFRYWYDDFGYLFKIEYVEDRDYQDDEDSVM